MTARDHRVACGQPRQLAEEWQRIAKRWAREHGLDVRGVLDMFDEIAAVCSYGGDAWEVAQARAWEQIVEIFESRFLGPDALVALQRIA